MDRSLIESAVRLAKIIRLLHKYIRGNTRCLLAGLACGVGWSSLAARRAHNPEAAGSDRARTTNLRMAGSGVKWDDRRGA